MAEPVQDSDAARIRNGPQNALVKCKTEEAAPRTSPEWQDGSVLWSCPLRAAHHERTFVGSQKSRE